MSIRHILSQTEQAISEAEYCVWVVDFKIVIGGGDQRSENAKMHQDHIRWQDEEEDLEGRVIDQKYDCYSYNYAP